MTTSDFLGSREWQKRSRFAVTASSGLLLAGVLGSTLWWSDHTVDYRVLSAAVVLGVVGALLTRLPSLARFWDRTGAVLGAILLSVFIAGTGGAESHYQDFLLIVPVAAGFLVDRRDFILALLATAMAAYAPVLYGPVDRHFVSNTTGDLLVWLAVGVGVHVLAGELQRRHDAVVAADAMKETFLRATSHELRTPLTVVQGVAQLLRSRDGQLTDEQRRHLLARLEQQAERLSRQVTDLLDVDRLSRGAGVLDLQEHALEELVAAVVGQMETNRHPLELRLDRARVWVDGAKFGRVIENLVANAVRHTPEGTHIWVTTSHAGGEAILTVEDDGPGIPLGEQPFVFEPFVQGSAVATDPSPGTGVGLTLVAQLTELHGGRVELEDREGGGTCFRVSLPAAPPAEHPHPVPTGAGLARR